MAASQQEIIILREEAQASAVELDSMQSFINALNKDTRALATEHDAACAEADALRSWLDDGAVGAAADLEAEVNATAGAVADRDRLQRTLNSSESEAASLRQQLQDAVDQHYVDAVSIPPPPHTPTHTHTSFLAHTHINHTIGALSIWAFNTSWRKSNSYKIMTNRHYCIHQMCLRMCRPALLSCSCAPAELCLSLGATISLHQPLQLTGTSTVRLSPETHPITIWSRSCFPL